MNVTLNVLDIILIVVTFLFTLKGFLRGFIKEIMTILGLLAVFFVSKHYYYLVLPYVQASLGESALSEKVAYFAMFFGSSLLLAIFFAIIRGFLPAIDSFLFNTLLGGTVGFATGVLFCSIVLIIITSFSSSLEIVNGSQIIPILSPLCDFIKKKLPSFFMT